MEPIDYSLWKFCLSPTPRFICGPCFVLFIDAKEDMINASPEALMWLEEAF